VNTDGRVAGEELDRRLAADLMKKLYDMAWDAARRLSVSGGGTDTGRCVSVTADR